MQTAADLWNSLNGIFLDIAPVAGLAALAISWILRKKRLDREEETVRRRIEIYRARRGLSRQQDRTGLSGMRGG